MPSSRRAASAQTIPAVANLASGAVGHYSFHIATDLQRVKGIRRYTRTAGTNTVKVFNGYGTTRQPTDVATTNTSTTITSAAEAAFAATDVGALITGTGIPAGTYITAVASATSATISAAATATGTITATIKPLNVLTTAFTPTTAVVEESITSSEDLRTLAAGEVLGIYISGASAHTDLTVLAEIEALGY